jgi:hypothetical protein
MRKLMTAIALLALLDTSVTIAQTVGSRNRAAAPSTNTGRKCYGRLPSATADRGPIKCPTRRTWVIRTIQSIAKTRRLTAWPKAFAAVAE